MLTWNATASTLDYVLVSHPGNHSMHWRDFKNRLTRCSFNFLDRNALVNAKLNTLDEDLGLKGTEYNTLISILFVGYIAGQIPSNMILNRVRPSWYMGGMPCLPRFLSYLQKLNRNRILHGMVDNVPSYILGE